MSWFSRFRDRAREEIKDVKNQGLIKWILTLNLLDILSTVFVIEWFGGTELNPIMAALLATHPVLFVVVKIFVLQVVLGLVVYSEMKGGRVPAMRFEGWVPKLYWKEGHHVPRWFWVLIITIQSLTLIFNTSMIVLGFLL